jgi:hypothetical protein
MTCRSSTDILIMLTNNDAFGKVQKAFTCFVVSAKAPNNFVNLTPGKF